MSIELLLSSHTQIQQKCDTIGPLFCPFSPLTPRTNGGLSPIVSAKAYHMAKRRVGYSTRRHMLEPVRPEAVLQHCIDDLRLTIDSLEPTHQDILTLLGNFRYRIEPRLKMMGIQLKWGVNDIPDLAYLNPRSSLQFLRIVQEAFANIVKHSQCREIGLKVAFTGNHIEVRIQDDGVGSEGTVASTGKGLKNMNRRAEQMGLKFTAGNRTDKQGFEVVIVLPVTQ